VRPTSDRAREAVFNILAHGGFGAGGASIVAGAAVLDAFCGTGAMGLEALSRGAARAVAIDRDARAVAAIAEHARAFGLAGLDARRGDARAALEGDPARYDVVFLDPPFADDPWAWLLPLAAARLEDGGAIYAEAAHPLDAPPGLVVARSARAGQVYYHLLRPEPGAPR
jgi:16S rRNA (guanine(966)-N(2))-methyltransferase RsmD